MTAMPAEQWPFPEAESEAETARCHEIEEQNRFDLLIETVAHYRELAFEYPTMPFYRRLLEEAEANLKNAEKNARTRWSRLTHFA